MGLNVEKLVEIPLNASVFLLWCLWIMICRTETLQDGKLNRKEGFKKKFGVAKHFLRVQNVSQRRKIGKNTPKCLGVFALVLVGHDVPR